MRSVPFERPENIDDALALLRDRKGMACLAGGTDLVVQMRDGRAKPGALLDLGGLKLDFVRVEPDHFLVGSGTTMTAIIEAISGMNAPGDLGLLAQAAQRLGAWQIQNRATVGGNLCNASPAADAVCALSALDAEVELKSAAGGRWLGLRAFLKGPGTTARKPDELLTAVRIPRREDVSGQTVVRQYLKVGGRTSLVCAIASVAARTAMEGDRVVESALALGSVAPTTVRAEKTEKLLAGKVLTEKLAAEAAAMVRKDVSPIDDLRASGAYRLDVAQAMVTEHLFRCLAMAKGKENPA